MPYYVEEAVTRIKQRFNIEVVFEFKPEEILGPGLYKVKVKIGNLGEVTFTRASGKKYQRHWRLYSDRPFLKHIGISFRRGVLAPHFYSEYDSSTVFAYGEKSKLGTFINAAEICFYEIDQFLRSIRVLGPFRTPPARRYAFSGVGSTWVGMSGEQAVNLLITEVLTKGKDSRMLNKYVSFWLKKMKLAGSIDVHLLVKRLNLFEVSLSKAGFAKKANFADVGFGISQILPVIVQGLLMPPRSVYIVQQPELHLHPDAQADLADFFINLSLRGVTCIVETHSEYFLVRLRRRLAERMRPILFPHERLDRANFHDLLLQKKNVSVIYVHEEDYGHSVESLELNLSFQFDNLPENFMNQALIDRMHLLKALKSHE